MINFHFETEFELKNRIHERGTSLRVARKDLSDEEGHDDSGMKKKVLELGKEELNLETLSSQGKK